MKTIGAVPLPQEEGDALHRAIVALYRDYSEAHTKVRTLPVEVEAMMEAIYFAKYLLDNSVKVDAKAKELGWTGELRCRL